MQDIIRYALESPVTVALFALFFGASIGSFLNVVIHRLPIMMYKEWLAQCAEIQKDPFTQKLPAKNINLATPASRCPACNTSISPLHNIPILSYILLGGRCRNCSAKISSRYFIIEVTCGVVAAAMIMHYGLTAQALFFLLFTFLVVPLVFIDAEHKILPDDITYLLLWSGIIFSLLGFNIPLKDSVIGAITGYLSLWSVYVIFKLLTKKEGMGFGDFKLLAAIGAWVGWQQLIPVILISTIVGSIIGIGALIYKQKNKIAADHTIPFGPYLGIAGWITLLWGEQITNQYLRLF